MRPLPAAATPFMGDESIFRRIQKRVWNALLSPLAKSGNPKGEAAYANRGIENRNEKPPPPTGPMSLCAGYPRRVFGPQTSHNRQLNVGDSRDPQTNMGSFCGLDSGKSFLVNRPRRLVIACRIIGVDDRLAIFARRKFNAIALALIRNKSSAHHCPVAQSRKECGRDRNIIACDWIGSGDFHGSIAITD